ncbi:alpha/beta hydrolase [[Mycobacterium] burgundiense]|uniref:Alpha/beta hydrolase n=1 Tax=[Mycobacterium] burgundiense TaxID=3064286 RepID=A0ABM9LSP1_9MYCO|nr:alpha/beta hydrolase [Mycolicibacterium sp. MU0053]CAJ1504039.1 alpha/beta hydrolase [Mycolicibacterium sp. MU0053]
MTTGLTVGDVERWRPEALLAVAAGWDGLAGQLREVADHLSGLDRTGWRGRSASRGWSQLEHLRETATEWAVAFGAAAAAARDGATVIGAAREEFLVLLASVRGDGHTVADDGLVTDGAAELTVRVRYGLRQVAVADRDVADEIARLVAAPAGAAPDGAAVPTAPAAAGVVSGWPAMSQDRIAEQIAAMSAEGRRRLIESAPGSVGNTDGVPWPMRIAANRINIAEAIAAQRQILARPEDDKIRAVLDRGFGVGIGIGGQGGVGGTLDPASAERLRAVVFLDPGWRAAAIAAHDRDAQRRIAFYRGLLEAVPDPTGRTRGFGPRQILAFDPARSSLIELHGDLDTAESLGVLVPGLNTTVLDSAANVRTARRFVAAGGGDVAMITYLGGPFPAGGDAVGGLLEAADPSYALQMAPRLVAFSEDVERTVAATDRPLPVTYIGHSYGGSILGTAERLGLTADRTIYVAAAGAGVGVLDETDWHNRNPDVQRYSMTAPGDPIEWVQGLPGSPHGADPDEMSGVWRLSTGRRLDGSEMSGLAAHSDIVNEPSDAWHNLLAVITGTPVRR